jgi:predicted outer membrane repeat protein
MYRLLIILLILIAASAQATTVAVPGDALTIQAGIDLAAVGDTVLVAPGTYDGPGNYNIDFGGRDIVLLTPAGPDSTIILVNGSAAQPRRGFIFRTGETTEARVEGFTVLNGHHEAQYQGGGAVWITNSSPTFVNCRFEGCYGYWGGAIRLAYSAAVFQNCRFENNSASHGGAVYCQDQSDANFHECTFKGNRAEEGGGVVFRWCFAPVVTNCVFDGNAASRFGGGILTKEGAAPLIEHCNLLRNQADTGGSGLYVHYTSGPPTVNNCIIAYGHDAPGVTADTGFFSCCNIVGHSSEDIEGSVAQQLGQDGNISLPVRFCGWSRADYYLSEESPCAPENNVCGELIGLRGVGDCAPEYRTWRVNPEGTGDAPTIQAAIDSALDHDTVMLAPGVYAGEGNRDIHFQAKSIVVRSQAGAEQTIEIGRAHV